MSYIDTSKIWSGIRYASIATGAGAISLFNKERARTHLATQLGAIPGIPAKLAQFLSTEHSSPPPLSLGEIKSRLELLCPKLAHAIDIIDDKGLTASLGQVHRIRLKDGQDLAVKVQFPGIKESLKTQVALATSLMEKSPARKYGLDAKAYAQFLAEHFEAETNYITEATQQEKFAKQNSFKNVVIPKIIWEYTTPDILVQTWEPSVGLDLICLLPSIEKDKFLKIWRDWFLNSLLTTGKLHADLQPQNWGYRPETNELVLYDFGAVLELDPKAISAIRRILTEESKSYDCMKCLEDIGFEREPLFKIEKELPDLCALLKRIFSSADTKNKIENLLGEKKWYFRTAGKPHVILLMRALVGYFSVLKTLGVFTETQKGTSAEFLKVRVCEKDAEVVSIEMPARAVEDLENLLDPETFKKITELGHNLSEIKRRAVDSGCTAQVLFEEKLGARHYRVWLE